MFSLDTTFVSHRGFFLFESPNVPAASGQEHRGDAQANNVGKYVCVTGED